MSSPESQQTSKHHMTARLTRPRWKLLSSGALLSYMKHLYSCCTQSVLFPTHKSVYSRSSKTPATLQSLPARCDSTSPARYDTPPGPLVNLLLQWTPARILNRYCRRHGRTQSLQSLHSSSHVLQGTERNGKRICHIHTLCRYVGKNVGQVATACRPWGI